MSSKSKKQIERYKLPASTDGICALVRTVLEGGHVDRIELDNTDAYVRLWRWVAKQDLEEPDVTWDGALRNIPSFMEYNSEGASSFQVLVDMMILAASKGLKPSKWVIGQGGHSLLQKWLLLGERDMPLISCHNLMNLEVTELTSIPQETLVLCCSDVPHADPSELTMVIKTTIDLRGTYVEDSIEDRRADGRVGDHPQEHTQAAHQLALSPRELRKVPWKSGRKSGKKSA
jgi:hypothetical protein